MIIVITHKDKATATRRSEIVASHGVVLETDEIVILPNVPPEQLGAKFDMHLGEYVIV